MTIIDRRGLVVSDSSPSAASTDPHANLAIKTPVRAATTANIALSGLPTIDGVSLVDGDRVLAKDQTAPNENGIYLVSSGNWIRTVDFDGPREAVEGTQVYINEGAANGGRTAFVMANDPIEPGTTSLSFVLETSSPSAADVAFVPAGGLSATDVQAALEELDGEKAPLASPAFTGNPTAPTPSPGDDDTSIATTGFVKAAIDVVLGGVSSVFDTLSEIATDLGGKLTASSDLADLGNVSAARTNLGLGTVAIRNTGTSGANVPLLNAANSWSSVQTMSGGVNLDANANFSVSGGNPAFIMDSGGDYFYYDRGNNRFAFVFANVQLYSIDVARFITAKPLQVPSHSVGMLPAGQAGDVAFAANCRVFNGAGVQEGIGAGTGSLVIHNGVTWKIAGTNVTAIA